MIILILTMGLMTNSIGYAYEDKPDFSILGTLKSLSPKFGLMQKRNWMQDYLRQGPTYCPWFMTCSQGRSMAFVEP